MNCGTFSSFDVSTVGSPLARIFRTVAASAARAMMPSKPANGRRPRRSSGDIRRMSQSRRLCANFAMPFRNSRPNVRDVSMSNAIFFMAEDMIPF